jgi:ABC-type glycerol-3-phosphate transport system permease component
MGLGTALAHKGDLSNLIGIALLAGCSLPPLLGLIPMYLKRRDFHLRGHLRPDRDWFCCWPHRAF